jgi:hypothetical protein
MALHQLGQRLDLDQHNIFDNEIDALPRDKPGLATNLDGLFGLELDPLASNSRQ